METALRRAGIPAFFVRGSRRPDPSGRALLALLGCAAEGLSAHRIAEYLSSAQVRNSPSPESLDGSLVGWAALWLVFRKVCLYPSPIRWFRACQGRRRPG